MKNNKMRIGYFKRMDCLITYYASNTYDNIEPKDIKSKTIISVTYNNSSNNNFTLPSAQVTPE